MVLLSLRYLHQRTTYLVAGSVPILSTMGSFVYLGSFVSGLLLLSVPRLDEVGWVVDEPGVWRRWVRISCKYDLLSSFGPNGARAIRSIDIVFGMFPSSILMTCTCKLITRRGLRLKGIPCIFRPL